jgi:outer membrane protein TolC
MIFTKFGQHQTARFLALIFLISLLFAACGRSQSKTERQENTQEKTRVEAVTVTQAAAIAREIPSFVQATGSLAAAETSDVTAKISGQVIATPVDLEVPNVPLAEAVSSAITNRQEIAQLQTSQEINQINARFYRDQTKPQIDLIGTYTGNGLVGKPTVRATNPNSSSSLLLDRVNQLSTLSGLPALPVTTTTSSTVSPNLVGGSFQSLSNLATGDYPTFRVGVRISLPYGNKIAKANLGRTLVEAERIGNQRAQTEQIIEADVRNTSQSLRSAEARLQSAAASRSSAEQLFASEQRQFRAGTSTVFLVLQRQNELVAARGRELQAQTDLNKAISQFQRATGTTLSANSGEISKELPPRNLIFRRSDELGFNLFKSKKSRIFLRRDAEK